MHCVFSAPRADVNGFMLMRLGRVCLHLGASELQLPYTIKLCPSLVCRTIRACIQLNQGLLNYAVHKLNSTAHRQTLWCAVWPVTLDAIALRRIGIALRAQSRLPRGVVPAVVALLGVAHALLVESSICLSPAMFTALVSASCTEVWSRQDKGLGAGPMDARMRCSAPQTIVCVLNLGQ